MFVYFVICSFYFIIPYFVMYSHDFLQTPFHGRSMSMGRLPNLSNSFIYNVYLYDAILDNGGEGSLGGGNVVTINGDGLDSGLMVSVCGVPCEIQSGPTGVSPETVTCKTGKVSEKVDVACDVTISYDSANSRKRRQSGISLGGSIPLTNDATPQFIALSKTRGGTAGGSTLVFTGTGFSDEPTVSIGGINCPVSAYTATEVTCITEAAIGQGIRAIPVISVPGKGNAWAEDVAELYFEYVDLWSSTYTWGCTDGTCFPKTGEIIVVAEGQHLVLDVDTPLLKALVVMGGTFEVDREIETEKVTLSAEYIIVTQEGKFIVGTEEEPYPCDKTAEIVLYGHRRSIQLPIYGAKVLAVRSGTLDLHGCRKEHTWGLLENQISSGDVELTMQIDVEADWQAGDEIVIATTGGHKSQGESETRIIESVSGNVVTVTEAFEHEHLARDYSFASHEGEMRTLSQRAEVGLLTRNVKVRGNVNSEWLRWIPECELGVSVGLGEIQTCFEGEYGVEQGSDQFGSQVMLHNVEYGKIEFVEVSFGGQAFGLGRYPLHFHLSGDQPNSYIRGCGIHNTFNRAATVHATNYLTVEHNVCYNVMGLTIFIEDGNEEFNVIQYNLAVFTRPSSSLLNVDQTPTSFWVTNPNNHIRHNHAAGSTHFGFWFNPPAHPTGPSFTEDYCPRNQKLLEFRNNTAHSCGVYRGFRKGRFRKFPGHFEAILRPF